MCIRDRLTIAEVESVNVNKWAVDIHFCLLDSNKVLVSQNVPTSDIVLEDIWYLFVPSGVNDILMDVRCLSTCKLMVSNMAKIGVEELESEQIIDSRCTDPMTNNSEELINVQKTNIRVGSS